MDTDFPFVSSAAPLAIVGNINLDIKTSPVAASPHLFDDGETSVEEIYESLGGGAANVAIAAARLGGHVHFCGCVGDDPLGARIEAALAAFGVTPHLRRKPVPTGRSINLNWSHHHRHFLSSLPNNRALTAADISIAELAAAGCRSLYRGDIWFSDSMLLKGNQSLLAEARAAGMTTAIDINWDPEWSVPGNHQKVTERISLAARMLPHVSTVQANEQELARFTGLLEVKKAAAVLRDYGCGEVVVHRGARGAAVLTSAGDWIEVPATPVEKVVCETGTGDVFTAAYLLLDSVPLPERLQACCRIAARHLQGSRILLPRLL
jgi:sugar/nucleoside kinase (ribokinase family)